MEADKIISALGWPHFAFIFALVFILLFKKELRGILGRITSIDKSGIKTQSLPEAQREEKKSADGAQELLLAIGDTVVLRDIEGRIKQELNGKGLETEGETNRVLVKYLAAALVAVDFEQIHNLIFGSQIFLLKKLNEVAGQGLHSFAVVAFFESVKQQHSTELSDWNLENYLQFLVARNLITTQSGIYHITNLGNEYLVWLARSGRSEGRPL